MWRYTAGIQSPDPLIDFEAMSNRALSRWDSVTRPLDRLRGLHEAHGPMLGFSHQTP